MQESLLTKIQQISEVERIVQNMWDKYLTDLEREEEEYLDACFQGDVKRIEACIHHKTKHPLDPKKCCND